MEDNNNRYFLDRMGEDSMSALSLSGFISSVHKLKIIDAGEYWNIVDRIPEYPDNYEEDNWFDHYYNYGYYYDYDYEDRLDTDKETSRDRKRKRKIRNCPKS